MGMPKQKETNVTRLTQHKPITTMLIDLDETVYPTSNGLWPIFRERMDSYLKDVMGFHPEVIPELRERLFHTYGTTLRGLQVEYTVDTDDFLEYVHDAPLEQYIQVDQGLIETLHAFPQRKYIFTNASRGHAQRILKLMGLSTLFLGIIDIIDIAPWCKPMPEAYQAAMRLIGASDPERILMVDDRVVNLLPARDLGMSVVLVGEQEPVDGIPHIATLAQLREIF